VNVHGSGFFEIVPKYDLSVMAPDQGLSDLERRGLLRYYPLR